MTDTRFQAIFEDTDKLLAGLDVDDLGDVETLLTVLFARPVMVRMWEYDLEPSLEVVINNVRFVCAFPLSIIQLARECADTVDEWDPHTPDGVAAEESPDVSAVSDDELITALQQALGRVRIYNMLYVDANEADDAATLDDFIAQTKSMEIADLRAELEDLGVEMVDHIVGKANLATAWAEAKLAQLRNPGDEEEEDGDEASEWTREDLEALSLAQLRKVVKDEFGYTAADIRELADLLVWILLDEDEGNDEDEDGPEYDPATMTVAELRKLARDSGWTAADIKGKSKDDLIALIFESAEAEEEDGEGVELTYEDYLALTKSLKKGKLRDDLKAWGVSIEGLTSKAALAEAWAQASIPPDKGEEGSEDESGWTRETLEALSLAQLRRIVKEELGYTASDIRGLDSELLIDLILEVDVEEEDEDGPEYDPATMTVAELRKLARDSGWTAADIKGKSKDDLIALIFESAEAEEEDDEGVELTYEDYLALTKSLKKGKLRDDLKTWGVSIEGLTSKAALAEAWAQALITPHEGEDMELRDFLRQGARIVDGTSGTHAVNCWIFQVDDPWAAEALQDFRSGNMWESPIKRHVDEVNLGDVVLLWRMGAGNRAGIFGYARVVKTGYPVTHPRDWKDESGPRAISPGIGLQFFDVTDEPVLTRTELKPHPEFRPDHFELFKMSNRPNVFAVDREHLDRMALLLAEEPDLTSPTRG